MTDQQLKAMFPKLLPERVEMIDYKPEKYQHEHLRYIRGVEVQDNQLLSLCREVEETFPSHGKLVEYLNNLEKVVEDDYSRNNVLEFKYLPDKIKRFMFAHASWQQRIQAAAEVRGVI